jgi:hypothetical protein
VSVNVRVLLLVKDDTTLYTMVTNVSTKRWTLTLLKFDEPFGVRFHFFFLNFLREPTSVNVRVVLLVGYYGTLYTMATSVSTKR